jgi:Tfp pilus assembly protein PilO
VIIYTDGGWPLWVRVLIAVFAVALLAVLGWRYYKHYWRR